MGSHQTGITWRAGDVPVSEQFGDPFYSLENGLAETRHVFLTGNDLPARLRSGFHVAELGVGTGLNLLALADIAQTEGVTGLRYTGFEAFPLAPADMARAVSTFPEVADLARTWRSAWTGRSGTAQIGPVSATIIIGDARRTLPQWTGRADAWFLDGFAPARNPELWEPALMADVARHTAAGGSFATYTAAGAVRRALSDAGFNVERCPGFSRKRHMTKGRLS
ncbi:MAG: tRNA (5-methylaminomethyl-2-thiouridine)(34)-methyltransferase MnmD [Pseudomonadota bacterium]